MFEDQGPPTFTLCYSHIDCALYIAVCGYIMADYKIRSYLLVGARFSVNKQMHAPLE
jgi:hypothetical protein